MTRWWRAYADAVHDLKVQSLPDPLFKRWFNILCVAAKNDGYLPDNRELTYLLRGRCDHVVRDLNELLKRGLLDNVDGRLTPHNWFKFQYKTDSSTQRVRAHRNAKRNVSETAPDIQRAETEKKQLSECKNTHLGDRSATRPNERFEEFWKAYPKREGANPRKPALAVFVAKLKAGATADEIIAGARACAARDHDKIGTPYIPQAARWLRDERWRDYSVSPPTPNGDDAAHGWTPGKRTSAEILAELENRNGKGARLETGSSVAEDGERLREDQPGLFRDHH